MIRYFSSASRNTERFVTKLSLSAAKIPEPPKQPFIVICPTYGDGDCYQVVLDYLSIHSGLCRGAIIGGNRNFGSSFGGAGKVIQKQFGIPTLYKFELMGTENDIEICREGIIKCLK